MKKILILAAIAAAALAVSCQNKEVSDPQEAPHDYRTVTLQLPIPEPSTKISIDETNGKVSWVPGDRINISGKYVSEMKVVELTAADISADGYHATITFDAAQITPYDKSDSDEYFAQYPADAVHVFRSSTDVEHYAQFNDTNKPLMAAYLDKANNVFLFMNLCGIISFTTTASFDSYVFSGNNDETVGYGQFAVKRNHEETYAKNRDEAMTQITGPVVADGVTPNYICLPWGADFTDGFTIRFKSGGTIVQQAKTSTPVNVGRNKILPLGDITGKLTAYVPEAHHSSITGATDLGASETANCYVITSPGSYKIPVVKGNSNESAGVRAKTKLLWETYSNSEEVAKNSVIAAVDYDDDDNYVYFKTPDSLQPGNALIAAVDEDENILWSWHIWIPADSIQDIGDYKVSLKYIMDRNLGAMVATTIPSSGVVDVSSVGLFYQWGRKDPFVGYKWGKTSVELGVSGAAGRSMTKLSAPITVEEAIAAPTSFVAYKGDWLSTHDDTLWGNGADKTIYDPCPAGYRVPAFNTDGLWQKLTTSEDFEASVDGHWWRLSTAVFPITGCYDYDGGISHPYDRTWLWTTKANSNADYGEAQYLYDNSGAWASEPGWGKRKACGVPVRCVKINGEVPEPEPDPATPATGISIDGDMSDWSDGEALEGDDSKILEWKYGYDSSNLYFYFKLLRSEIKYDTNTESANYGYYNEKRYVYVGVNTDNDKTTGPETPGYGGLQLPGCDALALVFAWRGHMDDANAPTFINGVDELGWIESPIGAGRDGNVTAYGIFDGDYAYLEIAIPREKFGSPTGRAKVQCSFSWNLTPIKAIQIN